MKFVTFIIIIIIIIIIINTIIIIVVVVVIDGRIDVNLCKSTQSAAGLTV